MERGSVSRIAKQSQSRFFRQQATLLHIATGTAGGEVFPDGLAAARFRQDMIQRDFLRFQRLPAVLAYVAVANQDVALGRGPFFVWNMHEMNEADHGWGRKRRGDRPKRKMRRLLHHGNPFENQDHRAPNIADMNRLVRRIQDKNPRAQSSGGCSFSAFRMPDCLLMHFQIKKMPTVKRRWAELEL